MYLVLPPQAVSGFRPCHLPSCQEGGKELKSLSTVVFGDRVEGMLQFVSTIISVCLLFCSPIVSFISGWLVGWLVLQCDLAVFSWISMSVVCYSMRGSSVNSTTTSITTWPRTVENQADSLGFCRCILSSMVQGESGT